MTALVCVSGCMASRRPASSTSDEDTLVPQETQRRAEQTYGQQEALTNDLSMTTSEQAGAAHESAVDRARDPGGESRRK